MLSVLPFSVAETVLLKGMKSDRFRSDCALILVTLYIKKKMKLDSAKRILNHLIQYILQAEYAVSWNQANDYAELQISKFPISNFQFPIPMQNSESRIQIINVFQCLFLFSF